MAAELSTLIEATVATARGQVRARSAVEAACERLEQTKGASHGLSNRYGLASATKQGWLLALMATLSSSCALRLSMPTWAISPASSECNPGCFWQTRQPWASLAGHTSRPQTWRL